jgi:hypothetical protein
MTMGDLLRGEGRADGAALAASAAVESEPPPGDCCLAMVYLGIISAGPSGRTAKQPPRASLSACPRTAWAWLPGRRRQRGLGRQVPAVRRWPPRCCARVHGVPRGIDTQRIVPRARSQQFDFRNCFCFCGPCADYDFCFCCAIWRRFLLTYCPSWQLQVVHGPHSTARKSSLIAQSELRFKLLATSQRGSAVDCAKSVYSRRAVGFWLFMPRQTFPGQESAWIARSLMGREIWSACAASVPF